MKVFNKNILVIEDNEFYMDLICNELEQLENVNIYRATNSADAYKSAMEI